MNDKLDVISKLDLPRAGLFSNGKYHVLLTQDGTGYSAFDGYFLTPWRENTRGAGTHLYLRDAESGTVWSSTFEPARNRPQVYEAWLAPGSFHHRRVDDGIETTSEVCVAPGFNAELRIYKLKNDSDRTRRLTLTTYAEVALNSQAADAGHPAFSKLFVETAYVNEVDGLLARRRPRSPDDRAPVLMHALEHGAPDAYETDREAFIGRGRSLHSPLAFENGLTGTTGAVLDPVLSMQLDVTLEPGEKREIILISAAGYAQEEVVETVRSLRREDVRADALLDSTVKEQQLRDALEIGPKNADRYHRLAAGVFRGAPELGPSSLLRPRTRGGERIERALGLDPALPLIVGRIADIRELPTAKLLLKARDFWRGIGLRTQVLLLNDEVGSDADELQRELRRVIDYSRGGHKDVVLRHSELLNPDEQIAVQGVARLWITDDRADVLRVEQDERLDEHAPIDLPEVFVSRPRESGGGSKLANTDADFAQRDADFAQRDATVEFDENLQAFNGFGGFSQDGREYVIQLRNGKRPPAPWVNVIANEKAGCIVSESGSGYTWTGNSREHRLTPWFNDPLLDPHGEALYLRDDASGEVWSPTPGPIDDNTPCEVRHGFGYTRFRKRTRGIDHETTVFVPRDDALKIVRVRLTNESGRTRRLSAASFTPWVLGGSLEERRFVVTEYDEDSGCLLARNAHNEFVGDQTAFAALIVPDSVDQSYTASAHAFLGKLSDPAHPQSLSQGPLDGKTGAIYDPCAAFLKAFELAEGETLEILHLIGTVEDAENIPGILKKHGTSRAAQESFDNATEFWTKLTSVFQVESPSKALDLLLNGWLLYQNLSCRIWGRSALYQSGGAFGFRDQLQDASAFAAIEPDLTREQIILHASHQFEDGDVLHWWHPPTGRGIRTRFSDDLLWLPYVALHYVETAGDSSIWDEKAAYVTGDSVPEGDDEILITPKYSSRQESIYQHCCRAIDRSLRKGTHGLPLMGSGDWNDGMNRVGREGKGESVWMAFFLHDILQRFVRLAEHRGDDERGAKYRRHASEMREAANDAGWDGCWYRRAYYDDGTPLGASENDEAQIDALAQAWSVISGAAPEDRAKQALDAVEEKLIDREAGIIRLLAPPFDKTSKNPGYIRGYVPGVRENGGQYTHAALWVVKAMAEAGRCDRAAKLLEMLSPLSHTASEEAVQRYRVEPYVVAADVYGAEPYVGRGGWTWYTGSAGWMQRVGLESIFGIRILEGTTLEIAPCIPPDWKEFTVRYRHFESGTTYRIHVLNTKGGGRRVSDARLDGEAVQADSDRLRIPVNDDGATHQIEVVLT